jgi:RNA polymerase sigma-70 factor, ECF subfamily
VSGDTVARFEMSKQSKSLSPHVSPEMAAQGQVAPALLRQDPAASAVLVDRLKRGDQSALAELYDQTSAILYGLMLRILGDPADAQEALVTAYARAWSQIHRFDPDRSGLLPWMILLARGVALERPGRKPVVAAEQQDGSDRAVLERAFFDGVVEGDLRGALTRLRQEKGREGA